MLTRLTQIANRLIDEYPDDWETVIDAMCILNIAAALQKPVSPSHSPYLRLREVR